MTDDPPDARVEAAAKALADHIVASGTWTTDSLARAALAAADAVAPPAPPDDVAALVERLEMDDPPVAEVLVWLTAERDAALAEVGMWRRRAVDSKQLFENQRTENAALRSQVAAAEDARAMLAVEAFTAPDADWLTIIDSLRSRHGDALRQVAAVRALCDEREKRAGKGAHRIATSDLRAALGPDTGECHKYHEDEGADRIGWVGSPRNEWVACPDTGEGTL